MKHCPSCGERYDEEIIRFCTKDGTPLVEDEQPIFTSMPSESIDEAEDPAEQTVIRRKEDLTSRPSDRFERPAEPERIIVPTFPPEQNVRPRTTQAYYPPPPPNTAKTVILTILGTVAVMGFGAVIFMMMRGDEAVSVNVNTNPINQNVNLNSNFGFDSNFNFNSVANFNTNYNIDTNLNSNLRTPPPIASPTPRPSPSPSVSPTTSPTRSPTPPASPTPRPNTNVRPSPTATPRTGPRPPTPNANRPDRAN